MKLKQLGSAAQYQEKFDMLLNRVDLSIAQAVSCFLSGLCDEIQCAVRMFKPASLHDAYCLAKLQEATLASITKRSKPILDKPPAATRSFSSCRGSFGGSVASTCQKFSSRSNVAGNQSGTRSAMSSTGSVSSKPRRVLTPQEIDEKRANNLCFFCDDKYHTCKGQVYRLEIVEEEEWMEEQEERSDESTTPFLVDEEQPFISLQALQGLSSFQTMRITGKVGSQPIHLLVDSGSTYNFLNSTIAKRLRSILSRIHPLVVAVAVLVAVAGGIQLKC